MRRIEAEVEIEAPAERVWEVLIDFAAYPGWNPFMAEVHGEARLGAILRARLEAPGAPRLRARLRVTKVEPPCELRWTGTRGLVRGERVITITPVDDGRVRLAQYTDFAGLLAQLLGFLDRYEPAMAAMNAALKARAEAPDASAALTVRKAHALALFSGLGGEYDAVGALLSFGQDPRWRRELVAHIRAGPDDVVLDVATGTGLVAREALALVGEGGAVLGLDPSAGMLSQARLLGIPLVRALGERLPLRDGAFDFVSMGFALRHVADLDGLFAEMRRVLKPGGTACVLEITQPRRAVIATPLRVFMTRVVPAVAGIARRRVAADRLMRFYWDTIEACVAPEAVLGALERSGLGSVRRGVMLGMFSEYVATKT
jgi:demethylmenaquinone methyltransferase/2-methoxy-6-polyprenyl-1,4-benzoquinol methylase